MEITQSEFDKMVEISNEWLNKLVADSLEETIIFDEYKITTVGKHCTYTRPHQIAHSPLSRCRV